MESIKDLSFFIFSKVHDTISFNIRIELATPFVGVEKMFQQPRFVCFEYLTVTKGQ